MIALKHKAINALCGAAFALAAFWLLAIYGADYLRKIESLSLFLPTRDFFLDCMRQPGGVLRWCSLFLTQTFHIPWLGASVYVVTLLMIAGAAVYTFRLPRWSFAIVLLIPAAILKMFMGLGYVIFSLKTPGFAFMMPVGVLMAFLMVGVCRGNARYNALKVVAIAAVGYWLFGFYGLLGAMLCCLSEIRQKRLYSIAFGVAAVALVPQLYFRFIPNSLRMEDKYTCCLPWLYDGESLWADYSDDNFRLTLALDLALQEGRWQDALDAAARAKGFEPTRLNVILTDMAMLRAGKLPDELLRYRVGSADYKTVRSLRVTHDAGAMMFSYHTGHVSYAYRWAMENKVEFGLNVEQLKMMAKCALLNGDYGVARKCLDNLSLTTFHKGWAARYRTYLDDPKRMDEDEEMSAVKRLMVSEEGFVEDHGQLEGYIWRRLAHLEQGNAEQLELSLIASMISFNIDAFINRITFYCQQRGTLPLYFQQAVLFWSKHNENELYKHYPIDQSQIEAYNRFEQAAQLYQQYGEEVQREQLRAQFGDTYWYYCYYMSGHMKII